MTFIHEKIRVSCENLKNLIVTEKTPVAPVYRVACGYKTENRPPENAEWEIYDGGEIVESVDSHYWFKFEIDIPEAEEGFEYRLRVVTGREGLWDARNPQCTVFVDGESAVQAMDTNHTWMAIDAGHHKVNLYFYNGMEVSYPRLGIYIEKTDLRIESLYYDLFVPYEAMKCLASDTREYQQICGALDRACLLLDFRHKYSADFYNSIKACTDFIKEEFYNKVCGKSEHEIALIGHTHIDVAWLWTLAQTKEKSQRSFSTVIRLMERYPEYIFMSSQPQLYQYVKENDPELYEKIKQKVKEGRWEPEGSMWLEADTNIISGESLVRQILLGKKFMMEEFGIDNTSLWLPDVFGYSAALPQILKKSGTPRFFTSKISWCETDKFPHDNFIWQGIDGSEVFAVLSDNYVKILNPERMLASWKNHVNKKYSDLHISTFGYGDGGGGPTAEMIENYKRMKYGFPGFPKLTMSKSAATIDRIKEQFDKNVENYRFAPKWRGELYLEMHRGTYTSIAKNKKNNRTSELLYQSAEALSIAESVFNADSIYPAEMFDANWHTILKNQFHDIIPGSSIKEVYDDSDVEYAKVISDGEKIMEDKLSYIASNVSSDGGILVYNSTPFEADGVIETENGSMYVSGIPANGWKVVKPEKVVQVVKAGDKFIENDIVRVEFDDKYHITSFVDKRLGREIIPRGEVANVLEVYEDYPREYDAWEITEYYKQKKWIADDVQSVEIINNGVTAGLKITRKYCESMFVQTITLKANSARLDFDTYVDWHEDHVLLKAAFPLDIRTDNALYEIQFGHIARPTHRNTSWDEAKFEVSAHKWADMSENGYGVSLLNNCKYGYSTDENVLRISLLKAATYPNPEADRGENYFTYCLYPHSGSVSEGGTIKEGYKLNKPLRTVNVSAQNGSIPAEYSLVSSSTDAFAVETVKKAEYGDDIIVRGYECKNGKAKVTLTFGFDIKSAYICDLMEKEISPAVFDKNTVTFDASNFEIVTLKITK